MGAWDIGIFDNDSALDILDMFEEINPIEFIKHSFELTKSSTYIEHDEAVNVLVSAALIDMALNKTKYELLSEEYPEVIKVTKKLNVNELKKDAVEALKVVISEQSELNELWSESEEYDNWKNNVIDLITRLSK